MDTGVENYNHKTWAETFESNPALFLQPRSVEDVQEIVRWAVNYNKNVVVVGANHSPSDITMTDGWLVSIDHLCRVISYVQRKTYTDVTVEAGIRLKDLIELLHRKGLALQNLGSISEQSVAGVISTGSHGASYIHGLISEQIVGLDIVTETGHIVTVSDHENKDLFKAALIGLGSFGIIVRAKLRCIPTFNIESRAYVLDFDKLLAPQTWNSIFLASEFHRIWWYPYCDKVYVWHGDKTQKRVPEETKSLIPSSATSQAFQQVHDVLLYKAIKKNPRTIPYVEKLLFKCQFNEKEVVRSIGRYDQEINRDCMGKQYVDEWSLPLNNGPDLLRALKAEIMKEKWYVHAPIEIRASNTTLPSFIHRKRKHLIVPLYGNITRPLLDPSPVLEYKEPEDITNDQLTLNLNAVMYKPYGSNPDYKPWFMCLESLCSKYGGKPHWAKNFISNPWLKEENLANVVEWKRQRNKWDPNHIFGSRDWLNSKGLS